MTPQQIFDKVADHLLKQGERSTDPLGDCQYRGEGGLSCAVGCLITDEAYAVTNIEGMPADDPDVLKALRASLGLENICHDTQDLLCELQNCHDMTSPEHWEFRLEQIAHKYDLQFEGSAA